MLTLLVLTSFDSTDDPRSVTSVPLVQPVLTLCMVALSLFLFVLYVNTTLRLMRISHVIARIATESFRVTASMPAPASEQDVPASIPRPRGYRTRAGQGCCGTRTSRGWRGWRANTGSCCG